MGARGWVGMGSRISRYTTSFMLVIVMEGGLVIVEYLDFEIVL